MNLNHFESITDNNNVELVSREKNNIYFFSKVTDYSVLKLIGFIANIEYETLAKIKELKNTLKENDEFYKIDIQPQPIKLIIQSNGGLVTSAFSAVAAIQTCKIPIHTYISGHVASAATLISIAGKKRYIIA